MKNFLSITLLCFSTLTLLAQHKLRLHNGVRWVNVKPHARIGLITANDSVHYASNWVIDSIFADRLLIKVTDTYEYKLVPYIQAPKFFAAGWQLDSIYRYQTDSVELRSYRLKKPLSYASKLISYNEITQLSYAKSENQSGCMGCIIFPVMVILAPIAAWEDKKFRLEIFVPFFTIGVTTSYLTYKSFKRREVINYKIGEWRIRRGR
jgi:hypothetical protein